MQSGIIHIVDTNEYALHTPMKHILCKNRYAQTAGWLRASDVLDQISQPLTMGHDRICEKCFREYIKRKIECSTEKQDGNRIR